MISVLAAAIIAIDPSAFYTPSQEHAPPRVVDFYTPNATAQTKKEEETEEDAKPDVIDRSRVFVYVDLRDVKSLRRLVGEFDQVPGLDFTLKDKSEVPSEGRGLGLPLLHFSTGPGKWGFRSGWRGPAEFVALWSSNNKDQGLSIGKSQARSAQPKLQATGSGYRARSHEWHIVGGESAASLRAHLAVPRAEHHGASFDRSWLATLSFDDLVGLHSDAHNGRVQWDQVPAKSVSKEEKQLGRVLYGTRDGKHPGPVGSKIRGFFGDPRYQYACPTGNCPWTR